MLVGYSELFSVFVALLGFVPAADHLLFRQKVAKPVTPNAAIFDWSNANFWRAGQLVTLRQGPLLDERVRPGSRAAGVDYD